MLTLTIFTPGRVPAEHSVVDNDAAYEIIKNQRNVPGTFEDDIYVLATSDGTTIHCGTVDGWCNDGYYQQAE